MGRWLRVGLSVCGVLALAGGCSSDTAEERRRAADLTEGCALPSDCTSPLVCAFERCHQQCVETRDCPAGQRCVKSEAAGVCQLPVEETCRRDVDCAGNALCSSDGRCRDRCDVDGDCLGAQRCATEGRCAEATEVAPDGVLIAPPASGGAGGGAGTGASGGTSGSAGTSGVGGVAGTSGSAGASGAAGGGGTSGSAGASGTGGSSGGAGADAGSCPTGYADCDRTPETCETSLALVSSCGSCTNDCSAANATPSCVNGACVIIACAADYADCNGRTDDGCEASLTAPTSCGSCGRDCGATTCNTGARACEAIRNYTSRGGFYDFALSPTAIFTANVNAQPRSAYTIEKTLVAGGAADVWASGVGGVIGGLWADTTHLYWSYRDGTGGNFVRREITSAGAAVVPEPVFKPAELAHFITQRNGFWYWMTEDFSGNGTIYRRDVAAASAVAGTQIMSVPQRSVGAFVTSTNAIFWTALEAGNLRRLYTVPLGGGAPTLVPAANPAYGRTVLVTSGGTLYFAEQRDSAATGIFSYVPGGTPTPWLYTNEVTSLAVDGAFLYYVTNVNARPNFFRRPVAGGAVQPVVVGGLASTYAGFVGSLGILLGGTNPVAFTK